MESAPFPFARPALAPGVHPLMRLLPDLPRSAFASYMRIPIHPAYGEPARIDRRTFCVCSETLVSSPRYRLLDANSLGVLPCAAFE